MSFLTTNSPAISSAVDGGTTRLPLNFDQEGWERLADTGIFEGVTNDRISPAARVRETAEQMKAYGLAGESPGLLFAVATHLASTITSVSRFGSEALKDELLPGLLTGELIGAHAITEPMAGSDAAGMHATAVVEELTEDVLLRGEKVFITNAPIASHIVVYARTLRDGLDMGVSAYVVDRCSPGVSVTQKRGTASLPDSPIGEVELHDVRVPSGRRLGAEGAGLQVLDYVMKREIIYAFSADLGRMQHLINDCISFVNSRKQFGAPISSFQSVAFTIADMYISLLSGNALISEVIRKLEENRDVTKEVSAAKIVISEAALKASIDAVHIYGAMGVEEGSRSIQHVVDALAGPIYSGTNRVQKTRIAAMLGLNDG